MRLVPTFRRALAILGLALVSLLPAGAFAQTEMRCDPVDLRIRIALSDERPPGARLRVELLNSSGNYADQLFTDDEGGGQFTVQRPGNYYLRVTGLTVKETTGPAFALRCNQGASFQFLTVKRSDEAEKDYQEVKARDALISALDMRVPAKARKEYERGQRAQELKQLEQAKRHFESAIVLYPDFARAHNSLGVLYTSLGDPARGIQSFEKAVSLNDHYSDALINLAKVRFNARDLKAADGLLKKALAADPNNLDALGLLVPTQFMTAQYDGAIDSARRVHAIPMHLQYAIVHVIAARALAAQNHPELALAEYGLFLQEAPDAPSAGQVRSEVGRLKAKLGE